MKKILVAAAMVAAITMSAAAADMPLKASVLAPAPAATWTGFYVGLNAGGFWSNVDQSLAVTTPGDFFSAGCFPAGGLTCFINTPDVSRAGLGSNDGSGFIGGFQVGANWQMGAWVFGIEADLQSFSSSQTSGRSVAPLSGTFGLVSASNTVSTDWLATIRGRIGFLAAPTWLIYATGGVAFANVDTSWTFAETRFGNTAAANFSNTETGWTVGAGVEVKFAGNWSVGAEYLYVDFEDMNRASPVVLPIGGGPTPQTFQQNTSLDAHIARVKLNYKF